MITTGRILRSTHSMGFWLVVARKKAQWPGHRGNPLESTFLRMGPGSHPDMQSLLHEEMENSCCTSGKPQFSPSLFSTMNLTFPIKYFLLSIKLITFHAFSHVRCFDDGRGWEIPEKEMATPRLRKGHPVLYDSAPTEPVFESSWAIPKFTCD